MEYNVGRPPVNPHGAKHKLSVTLDPDVLEWLDAHIGVGKRFATRSQAIEWALVLLSKREHLLFEDLEQ